MMDGHMIGGSKRALDRRRRDDLIRPMAMGQAAPPPPPPPAGPLPSLYADFIADSYGWRPNAAAGDMTETTFPDLASFITGTGATFARSSARSGFDASGTLVQYAAGQPILDYGYDVATATWQRVGLLIEGFGGSGGIKSSEDFSVAPWSATGGATVTAAAVPAPNGGAAQTLASGGNPAAEIVQRVTGSVSNRNYTCTVFLRAGTSTMTRLVMRDDLGTSGAVDIIWAGGLPSASATGAATAFLEDAGPDWHRVGIHLKCASGATWYEFAILPSADSGAGDVIAWGAQSDLLSYPQSYVPESAKTYSDQLRWTFGGWAIPGQGTIFAEWAWRPDPTLAASKRFIAGAFDSAAWTAHRVMLDNGYGRQARLYASGTGSANIYPAGGGDVLPHKVAVSYSSAGVAMALDGAIVGTGSMSPSTAMDVLAAGGNHVGSYVMSGHLRRFEFYVDPLSDADLQALTA